MSAAPATPASAGIVDLVREDLRAFAGYKSARSHALDGLPAGDTVWLNANESPWANPADDDGAQRRYPQPQPEALRARLAEVYGVRPEQLLIGRGSDEAIDLLVRALCRAEHDPVVIAPPVFGMYAVCARLQGAPIIEAPLRDYADGWIADLAAMRDLATARRLSLVWGTYPVQTPAVEHVTEIVDFACATAAAQGMAEPGGIIAIAAGMPFGVAGTTTNLLRIARLPERSA